MKKLAAFLALMVCSGTSWAACVPSQATGNMMGCEPIAGSVLGTDYVQVWVPGAFPRSAQLISASNLFSSGFAGSFASPPPMGNITPNTGAFTTLNASGTLQVGGAGTITGFGTGIGQALGPLISRGGNPSLELHGQMIFNQASPTNATGPDLFLRHDGTSVTGGSGSTINQVLQASQTIGSTDATQNWTLVSKMNTNNTVGAQALSGYLQSWRNAGSNAWIWGAVVETSDFTGHDSATVGNPTNGMEIDLGTTSSDNAVNPSKWGGFGNRHMIHFVGTRNQGSAENEISTGLWFGTANTQIDSIIGADLGAGAAGASTYQVVDARGFIAPPGYASPVAAVRMSAGQVIDFNGGASLNSAPGATLSYDTGTAAIVSSGNFGVGGTLTSTFSQNVTTTLQPFSSFNATLTGTPTGGNFFEHSWNTVDGFKHAASLAYFEDFLTSAATGGRNAVNGQVILNSTTADGVNNNFYNSGAFDTIIGANQGGTNFSNTSANAVGAFGQVDLNAGATFIQQATGLGAGVNVAVGASVNFVDVIQVAANNSSAAVGNTTYNGIALGGNLGSTGFKVGIAIGDAISTGNPIATTGTIMAVQIPAGSPTMNFGHGIDFSNGVFASDAFKSPGFLVDGSGNLTAASYKAGATAGVSCTAGTVNLTTEVVTNGIVTHC